MKRQYIKPEIDLTSCEMTTIIATSINIENNTPDGDYEGRINEYNNAWDLD